MAQEFVAGAAQNSDASRPVQWRSRAWRQASIAVASAGLICTIIVLSSTWNGVHVFFVDRNDPSALAEAQVRLLGRYVALLALGVFLIGLGVLQYIRKAQR